MSVAKNTICRIETNVHSSTGCMLHTFLGAAQELLNASMLLPHMRIQLHVPGPLSKCIWAVLLSKAQENLFNLLLEQPVSPQITGLSVRSPAPPVHIC